MRSLTAEQRLAVVREGEAPAFAGSYQSPTATESNILPIRQSHNTGADARDSMSKVRRDRAARWTLCQLLLNEAVALGSRGKDIKMTLEELGEAIGAKLAPAEAFDPATVHRFFKGKREPGHEITVAFCAVLHDHGIEVDPGWLEFGNETAAPAPEGASDAALRLLAPPGLVQLSQETLRRPDANALRRRSRARKGKGRSK